VFTLGPISDRRGGHLLGQTAMLSLQNEFDPLAMSQTGSMPADLAISAPSSTCTATLECGCDGVTLIGRSSIVAYWAPKSARRCNRLQQFASYESALAVT
jgi:hypothetical protein